MNAAQPALLGGPPIRPSGPPSWPFPDDAVRDALLAAYGDGSWGKYHGPHVEGLEKQLADYHGVTHALTCGSGTFAVELALRALQVGPGDEVVLAAYDFPGNFLAIHAIGAMPVLADIAPDSWNLTPEAVAAALSPTTKAVIVSHLHGGIVPMPELMDLVRGKNVAVVEDACQCPGALIAGRKAGTWGDVGVLSFGGSKLLTAGRGGAILTNRADVHQRARLHQLRGNLVCPLSELQAAVLLPQLAKLDDRNAERDRRVAELLVAFQDIPGLRSLQNQSASHRAGYYKLGFQFDASAFGLDRAAFLAAVRAEGIAFDEGFRAAHVGRSPRRFCAAGPLTEASRADTGMVVLHHPVLLAGADAVAEVADAVRKIHRGATALRERCKRQE
jgi:dTDP-4-amino-4,6-dideoxygalactose transaminase